MTDSRKQKREKLAKKSSILTAMLPLAACGGGGGGAGGGDNPTPTSPTPPAPDLDGFSEVSAFVYEASDSAGGWFSFHNSPDDLSVTGGDGNDYIIAGGGDDNVIGGAGNDTINGLAGADTLDGGAGFDILKYDYENTFSATEGVNVNLSTNTASGGDAEGDVISNFEGLHGSIYDDIFTGNNDANILSGGEGNDVLTGLGGNDYIAGGLGADIMDGGEGFDMLVYTSFYPYFSPYGSVSLGYVGGETGIYVNLETQTTGRGNSRDQISNFEGAIGSTGDDELIGALNSVNYFYGGRGDDIITGGNLDDNLYGDLNNVSFDDGDDTIYGGAGNDRIQGSGGNNTLYGGEGSDIFDLISGANTVFGDEDGDKFILYGGDPIYNNVIDGGEGYDTFLLGTASFDGTFEIDLSLVDAQNIESFSLGVGDNAYLVSLTVSDVIDITDGNNTLIFTGTDEDEIVSIGEGWVQGADQVVDAYLTYHTYTAGGATLLIDDEMVQTIS